MPHKGPHISISPDYVVNRILRINIDDFAEWPESVRSLAIAIAEELFLVAYNPFIDADTVRDSVRASFDKESVSLAHYYATAIGEGITMFWSAHEAEMEFREKLIDALGDVLPAECILTNPGAPRKTSKQVCFHSSSAWPGVAGAGIASWPTRLSSRRNSNTAPPSGSANMVATCSGSALAVTKRIGV